MQGQPKSFIVFFACDHEVGIYQKVDIILCIIVWVLYIHEYLYMNKNIYIYKYIHTPTPLNKNGIIKDNAAYVTFHCVCDWP